MKCKNIEILNKHITDLYNVKSYKVSEVQVQFKIDGFVVNIYDNGTVNFQGKPNEELKKDISTYIEIINKKEEK